MVLAFELLELRQNVAFGTLWNTLELLEPGSWYDVFVSALGPRFPAGILQPLGIR
jgi:hypothetical protein